MWVFSEKKDWSSLENQFDWVKRMQDVPQDPKHHAEGNVAIHTQMVLKELQQCSAFQKLSLEEQEVLWTAALLHDVEKYSTTVHEPDGSITSSGHARKGAQFVRRLLYMDRPAPFAIREQLVGLVRHHGLPIWLFEKEDPIKALVKASMEVNIAWLALLARADILGRVCSDRDEMLYRIDCFEMLCKEKNCWGTPCQFSSGEALVHYMKHEDAYLGYVPFDQPKVEVVLMSGLPGAGKDTFIKRNFADWPVVSLDTIRLEKGVLPTDKKGNGQVVQEAKERARSYLRKQQSFVWNATNTTLQMRTQLIELFLAYKAKVRMVYVEVPYQKLHGQNKNRDAIVPHTVLDRLVHKLEVPALWEAHEIVFNVI